MNRLKTGIKGFDKLVEGGFPEGRSFLLSGGTGTGKTIFSMQFLMSGIEDDEPGIYLTLDERPDLIREDMKRFGWDLRSAEDDGKLMLIDGTIAKIGIPSDEEFSLPATGFDLDKLLLEIMKAMTDNNITSDASKLRVESFNASIELQSMTELKIVLEGILFDRICQRMNEDQINAYQQTHEIDKSAVGLTDYDYVSAINWIATNKYSKIGKVIILTETSNFSRFKNDNQNIYTISPADFIKRYELFLQKIDDFRKLIPENEFTDILVHKLAQKIFFN